MSERERELLVRLGIDDASTGLTWADDPDAEPEVSWLRSDGSRLVLSGAPEALITLRFDGALSASECCYCRLRFRDDRSCLYVFDATMEADELVVAGLGDGSAAVAIRLFARLAAEEGMVLPADLEIEPALRDEPELAELIQRLQQ